MRSRITIDTDLIFHGNNNGDDSNQSVNPATYSQPPQRGPHPSQKPPGESTDRWVEEQFNLGCFGNRGEVIGLGQVKETDILSDDDEYCKSVRAACTEPADLQGEMEGLHLHAATGSHSRNGRGDMLSGTQRSGDQTNPGADSGSLHSLTPSLGGVSLSRCAPPPLKLAPVKQCTLEGATKDRDSVWVRRDDLANGCNGDVF